jgi:hypothetical protein
LGSAAAYGSGNHAQSTALDAYSVTEWPVVSTFTMVFSSGLAPAVIGFMVDWPITIESISLGCILYCLIAAAIATFAREPTPREA